MAQEPLHGFIQFMQILPRDSCFLVIVLTAETARDNIHGDKVYLIAQIEEDIRHGLQISGKIKQTHTILDADSYQQCNTRSVFVF